MCASDTLAMGVLHTLRDRGLTPGHDISVIGFDDSQVSQVIQPGLTSVRQPLEEVAVEIVRALEGLLSHPPVISPGVLLTPDAGGARDRLIWLSTRISGYSCRCQGLQRLTSARRA